MFEIKAFQPGLHASGLLAGLLWRCLPQMDGDQRALQAEGRGWDGSQGRAGPSLRVCTALRTISSLQGEKTSRGRQ